MWCLVSQPNSDILEVKVDPKAIGQTCLEKVCESLGIGPEADYFGLRLAAPSVAYAGTEAAPGTELPGGGAGGGTETSGEGGPWVNLRNPLPAAAAAHHQHRRRAPLLLRVKFWVPPHRLLQESTRRQFYRHARLGLLEGRMVVADWTVACRLVALIAQAEYGDCDPEYPPMQEYTKCHNIGPQNEKPLDYVQRIIDHHLEIEGMQPSSAEYQLLKEISNLESFGEELFFCRPPRQDNSNNAHSLYTHLLYHNKEDVEMESRNAGKNNSIYASQTVGCLTTGGHHGREAATGCGCKIGMCVGVSPGGIRVYRPGEENETQSIPYTAIIRATPVRRLFQLQYLNAEGAESCLYIKMATSRMAAALYRAVTEKHAFYCCETVRSDVTKQFIRDLKGTIVSIFNEESTLGKKYVFDIRRTYTEVYDNARRALHAAATTHHQPHSRRGSHASTMDYKWSGQDQRLQLLADKACCICMDRPFDTVFLPCRHMICCPECSSRCTNCPLCRTEISSTIICIMGK